MQVAGIRGIAGRIAMHNVSMEMETALDWSRRC
jgi:hypothetical protein